MNIFKKSIIALAIATPLSVQTAQASEQNFYVGISGGLARFDMASNAQQAENYIVSLGYTTASVTTDQQVPVFKLFTGMNINQNFAAEIFYASLGTINSTVATTGPVSTATATDKVAVYGLDLLGKLPLNSSSAAYARLGYYSGKDDWTATGTLIISGSDKMAGLKMGLGYQIDITEQVVLSTDWEYYSDSQNDPNTIKVPAHVFSLGAALKF